jgi:hypothetical protein
VLDHLVAELVDAHVVADHLVEGQPAPVGQHLGEDAGRREAEVPAADDGAALDGIDLAAVDRVVVLGVDELALDHEAVLAVDVDLDPLAALPVARLV